ncbi:MAG: acetyltransferase [Candidatus Nitrohelix vancouverensis]|uniref:Acetyltransferase n=1 Tax=Candidatus Nitrohelix vancouverensis TaxID=2705534 RepID=A0A7T0C027_9BACT|nr:MAG: acetyltransferase [Candidatus Nitrohelix vancouverensis]
MRSLPVIILGAGGHARVLADALKVMGLSIKGVTDAVPVKGLPGVPLLGDDSILDSISPDDIVLVNGLGSIARPALRRRLFEKFKARGFTFQDVVHPSAMIAEDVRLGEGVQVMAGAVIQTGSVISDNAIINTGALVDHDCEIGAHTHLAPGVTLSGRVTIGEESHVGVAASVIQSIRIGSRALIGAGSVVVRNVPESALVYGNPAKEIDS